MDPVDAYVGSDTPFTALQWGLILTSAALIRVIPLLILASAAVKLHRFPDLRPLHVWLLIAAISVVGLGLIEVTGLRHLRPAYLLTSGVWALVWMASLIFLGVTWTRSAIKTRLRPRALDTATLVCAATLVICGALIALATP